MTALSSCVVSVFSANYDRLRPIKRCRPNNNVSKTAGIDATSLRPIFAALHQRRCHVKITQVDLYEVEIPPIAPIARYFPKIYDITLCRVQTDEGWWDGVSPGHARCSCGRRSIDRTRSAGVGPLDQPDAFTCALLDIAGRAYGLPVHRFGRQVRDRVPVPTGHVPSARNGGRSRSGPAPWVKNHKLKARSWNIVETARQMKEATGPEYYRR